MKNGFEILSNADHVNLRNLNVNDKTWKPSGLKEMPREDSFIPNVNSDELTVRRDLRPFTKMMLFYK